MLYTALMKSLFGLVYGAPPDLSAERDDCSLVLVADGVGGLDLCATGLRHVMGALRTRHIVRTVPWGHGFGRWHADLTNEANHDAHALAIVRMVEEFRATRPGAAVFLVGKSGGTGLVVMALEHLPAETIEAVVLLSPALSPGYDLTRALRAVRRELVVFWSPFDVFVLGLGTRIFGTIDRIKGVSAGLVGFRVPATLDEAGRAAYAKLKQVRWHPAMAPTGYFGGHVGPDSPAFLRKYVVPLLRVAGPPEADSGAEVKPGAPRADKEKVPG